MKYFYLHFLFLVLIFRPQRREILCRGRSDSGWRFICSWANITVSTSAALFFVGKFIFPLGSAFNSEFHQCVVFFSPTLGLFFPDSEMVLFALKESNYGLCLPLNGGNFLYSSYLTYV